MRAPASTRWRSVGTVALMRVSSVIWPAASSGTL